MGLTLLFVCRCVWVNESFRLVPVKFDFLFWLRRNWPIKFSLYRIWATFTESGLGWIWAESGLTSVISVRDRCSWRPAIDNSTTVGHQRRSSRSGRIEAIRTLENEWTREQLNKTRRMKGKIIRRKNERGNGGRKEIMDEVSSNEKSVVLHLFPTNFGQSACNSVKVQPISTLRLPNHARPARRTAEPPKLPALFPKCMHCRLNWPEKGVNKCKREKYGRKVHDQYPRTKW